MPQVGALGLGAYLLLAGFAFGQAAVTFSGTVPYDTTNARAPVPGDPGAALQLQRLGGAPTIEIAGGPPPEVLPEEALLGLRTAIAANATVAARLRAEGLSAADVVAMSVTNSTVTLWIGN